jgi:hypothetical protein
MTVLALVFGAAILLTWMLVHSYSRRQDFPTRRRAHPAHADCGGGWWIYGGSDGSAGDCTAGDAGDCSAGDAGGGGGDGGGD